MERTAELETRLAGPAPAEIDQLLTFYNQKRYEEAKSHADTFTKRFPTLVLGWQVLGAALMYLGRATDALAPTRRVAELLPMDAGAHTNMGIALQATGQHLESEASFRRALEIDSNSANAHCNLGNTLSHLGRLNDAEACYISALRINPDFTEASTKLNLVRSEMERFAKAEADKLAVTEPPLVSIMIPSYRPQYFEFALKSAIAQSYENIEIIISDDCPNDEIEKIVARYGSVCSIRYSRNPNPDGIGCTNLVNCLRHARGEYVKFLFDDDVIMPFAVQFMVDAFLANKSINPRLVVSERWIIDSEHRFIGAARLPVDKLADITDSFLGRLMATQLMNPLGEFTSAMWRRDDTFDESGKPRFSQLDGRDIVALVDMAMWLNLAQIGRVLYIPLPLSCFRRHAGQNSNAKTAHWFHKITTEYEIIIDHAVKHKLISKAEELASLNALLRKYRNIETEILPLKAHGDLLEDRIAGLRAAGEIGGEIGTGIDR